MKQTNISLPEIKLVGITVRTNNNSEMDQATGKIGPIVQKYFQESISEKIHNRKTPYVTFSAYTEYESDHNGDYTYFIGEEVDSFSNVPENLVELIIPAQNYTKFTNGPGKMPNVCLEIWQNIWNDNALNAKREYITDFEIYDQRAIDRENTTLDIYIGIKQ
ncbi:MAG UNVERIFIED_CONTAM: GyrI-like domain-containing protein [Planctomycetaceae bacterium]|jgi:predicted transcriptional regulator YdeE